MGNKIWTQEQAITWVTPEESRKARKRTNHEYFLNYKEWNWYPANIHETREGANDQTSRYKFLTEGDTEYEFSVAESKSAKLALAGNGEWGVGDEVLVYWNNETLYLYRATVVQIDDVNCVALLKTCDGKDTWFPVGYIHKFVTLGQHLDQTSNPAPL